jgi:hypothetical protein
MARALYLYLGPAVLDDGNHAPNDVDDFATIFEFVMASFNLNDLLPNPLLNNGDYKVTVENISFQPAQVQLIPITGGMQMHISIDNFHADIDADGKCFFCPSADGTIDIDRMIIIAPVKIKTVNGAIDVQLQDPDVTLVNPDVDINGILGSILDFIVDLVIDGLAPSLEEKFEEELGTLVPGILEEALDSLAFNTSFDMPAIFPGGGAVTINLQTGLEHTFWTTEGGILRMWGAATTSKAIPYSVLGTIRRDGCSTGISESLQLSKAGDLQFGLSNDLLNQILFSVWWGGGLSFPIPPEDLVTQDLSGFGVSDLTLEIDFLLPPMITNCNSNQDLVLQLGDVRVHATAILFGKPIELDIFITAEAYVELGASAAGVSLAVSDIKEVASEVVVLTSGYATAESLVDTLVSEEVTPLLFEQLGSEALAGFPLPAIDLSGLADGVPSGTAIAIDPNNAEQVLGWTVVSGSIQ